MGAASSSEGGVDPLNLRGKVGGTLRIAGFTEGARKGRALHKIPQNVVKARPDEYGTIINCLSKLLIFDSLDENVQMKIVKEMYERQVMAGDILIQEGDSGLAASELYVVKSGEFEILERRQGVNMRVNMKFPGDCFGEVSLMYSVPRNATVAATQDSTVWVLERETFRQFVRESGESKSLEVELFLNSVPLLAGLSREEKQRLLDAFDEQTFAKGQRVINEGDVGDMFYVIREGEAVVYQDGPQGLTKVNHLFKGDFFGERALLTDEPRTASVEATTRLVCLTLKRDHFVELLGPLSQLMNREKSTQVVTQRLIKLETKGSPGRTKAEILIKRRKRGRNSPECWEAVRARGHLDEVLELRAQQPPSKPKLGTFSSGGGSRRSPSPTRTRSGEDSLVLVEGAILGGGAFSRVSIVTEESTGRQYAMKRMRKVGVVQCPEHVFCEQTITRNTAHPFCIRQYASFQDKYHLYFLFDLMAGGDLMDVLVAEAKVIRRRIPAGPWRRACFAPKVKMLKGMDENLAKVYIGSIVLALEYLHDNHIVYRDLKPENVFIDSLGYIKLGDFGFAKVLEGTNRTYTFCGTPGYVAPENVLAHGYNYSVDWWGLGVLLYVLLTGRQPFSSPKTDDPMVVMRRIVDDKWSIKYPPYISPAAKDLVSRLLERRPGRRLGMLAGKANDIKQHRWFDGLDWEALAARKLEAPRRPQDDSAKRLKELLDVEKKHKRDTKETPEELAECDLVFADF